MDEVDKEEGKGPRRQQHLKPGRVVVAVALRGACRASEQLELIIYPMQGGKGGKLSAMPLIACWLLLKLGLTGGI